MYTGNNIIGNKAYVDNRLSAQQTYIGATIMTLKMCMGSLSAMQIIQNVEESNLK